MFDAEPFNMMQLLKKDDLVNIKDNFVEKLQDIRFYLTGNQVLVSDFLCVPEHFRSM